MKTQVSPGGHLLFFSSCIPFWSCSASDGTATSCFLCILWQRGLFLAPLSGTGSDLSFLLPDASGVAQWQWRRRVEDVLVWAHLCLMCEQVRQPSTNLCWDSMNQGVGGELVLRMCHMQGFGQVLWLALLFGVRYRDRYSTLSNSTESGTGMGTLPWGWITVRFWRQVLLPWITVSTLESGI